MQCRVGLTYRALSPHKQASHAPEASAKRDKKGFLLHHLHVPAGKGELTSRLACYQLGNYSSLCDYSSNCYCHCYCCCCYCYCYGYLDGYRTGYRLPATGYRYCCRYGHGYCYCYYLLLLLLPLLLLLLLRLLLRLLLLLLLLHLCLRLRLLLLLLPLRTHSSYYYYCNTATTAAITISVCDFCHRLSL